jgi:hypothetical protein
VVHDKIRVGGVNFDARQTLAWPEASADHLLRRVFGDSVSHWSCFKTDSRNGSSLGGEVVGAFEGAFRCRIASDI